MYQGIGTWIWKREKAHTKIFLSWTNTLGAETTAMLESLVVPASSSSAKAVAVSSEYYVIINQASWTSSLTHLVSPSSKPNSRPSTTNPKEMEDHLPKTDSHSNPPQMIPCSTFHPSFPSLELHLQHPPWDPRMLLHVHRDRHRILSVHPVLRMRETWYLINTA